MCGWAGDLATSMKDVEDKLEKYGRDCQSEADIVLDGILNKAATAWRM